ncbi:MAG: flagellar biosynthesis protein FlhB [Phycisphaerales bacterium]|nr:flagellar biosynthesis protein FlhB [Phycisphaerales bacterium]MCB9857052.1 flagellar biosynthesis protein FlhB [Phycisphaerales bacterium]MCB9861821.1 flagellar biosynthesis protein FlhB [Phycisphaerales bacterium]
MPDDAGEKTEAPTPRRLQEARNKGQIARSADLNSALLLLGGLVGLRLFGPQMIGSLHEMMRRNLSVTEPAAGLTLDVAALVPEIGMIILGAAGPVLLVLIFLAIASNMLQVGFLFTTEPLAPKLDKLNPINGVTRMFSSRTAMQLVMNLVKLGIVTAVATVAVNNRLEDIMNAMALTGWPLLIQITQLLYDIGLQLALALLVIALLDFGWQKWKHMRDLRMTKQEVREEMRSMEGDPRLRQRRRRMQMTQAMQRIQKAVPTADVIVTNPTELAIAIKYNADAMAAPKVVAKGADHLAKKIREIAIMHGIPIIERKPLAQALYKTVEVGQEVPEHFYQAIAEILAYVYRLSGKKLNKRRSKTQAA